MSLPYRVQYTLGPCHTMVYWTLHGSDIAYLHAIKANDEFNVG